MARDALQRAELLDAGWQILQVWESDIRRKRTREDILAKIETFLTADVQVAHHNSK
jgi:G:T-mismatch repair DNA endonuclease (very short patch repair protein)